MHPRELGGSAFQPPALLFCTRHTAPFPMCQHSPLISPSRIMRRFQRAPCAAVPAACAGLQTRGAGAAPRGAGVRDTRPVLRSLNAAFCPSPARIHTHTHTHTLHLLFCQEETSTLAIKHAALTGLFSLKVQPRYDPRPHPCPNTSPPALRGRAAHSGGKQRAASLASPAGRAGSGEGAFVPHTGYGTRSRTRPSPAMAALAPPPGAVGGAPAPPGPRGGSGCPVQRRPRVRGGGRDTGVGGAGSRRCGGRG